MKKALLTITLIFIAVYLHSETDSLCSFRGTGYNYWQGLNNCTSSFGGDTSRQKSRQKLEDVTLSAVYGTLGFHIHGKRISDFAGLILISTS